MSMFVGSACCGVLFVDVPLLVSSMSMSSRLVESCCSVVVPLGWSSFVELYFVCLCLCYSHMSNL